MNRVLIIIFGGLLFSSACSNFTSEAIEYPAFDTTLQILPYKPLNTDVILSREEYAQKLYGFWLGECIANWTGLVTEMDKIGNIGEIKTGDFYTRKDWGQPDQPNIWNPGIPSPLSETIDFVFMDEDSIWGADDDTDIEYMYQYLLSQNKTPLLSGNQIKEGWLKHIRKEEENYLWVSNQQAFDLMEKGVNPPYTSDPKLNPHFEMIDAQLTTELFGLLSPLDPPFALLMADLPIRTTASGETANIAQFYVIMHSMAAAYHTDKPIKDFLFNIADIARIALPDTSYMASMFHFVKMNYENGTPWETTRDSLYVKYQVNQADGYLITSQNLYCNGCFAAGINFGSSLISLFYGEGDIKETIKIGSLCGWDSDNPTATWGGLLGFMLGKEGVERAFGRTFSNKFNIHRTRQNFPNNGIDTFEHMAETGVQIIDRVVQNHLKGGIDTTGNRWYIPVSPILFNN